LRIQKLKAGNFLNSVRHSLRTIETPNADKDLRSRNTDSVKSVEAYREKLQERLATVKKTIRKDATAVVEYLVTASPEVMAKMAKNPASIDNYFAETMTWIERKHGKENILGFGVHRDEGTPHLYCYVTPITKDHRLSAKSFYDGPKALSEMQTDFAQQVGLKHGLERGIMGSRAHHRTIRSFYTEIEKTAQLYREMGERNPAVVAARKELLEMTSSRDSISSTLHRVVTGDVKLMKELKATIDKTRERKEQGHER
jgi:hypothetical protein